MRPHTTWSLACLASFACLLLPGRAALAEDDAPPGWTTTVKRLEGSERRLWYLALVSHETSRHVTLVVSPVCRVGQEGRGIDGERIERSESGDLHQIALWAEQLRRDAEGWKRPSLRDRPPASAHVVGVVRSVTGETTVGNAEHGGGRLTVGDLLFVEDVLSVARDGVVGFELLGPEDLWHHRWTRVELVCGHGARVGLRRTSDTLLTHLHEGDLLGRAFSDGVRIRTNRATYAPDDDAAFLLAAGGSTPSELTTVVPRFERLDVRSGTVVVESATAKASVGGGSALAVAADGQQAVTVLDEDRWAQVALREPTCTREQALRTVARAHGIWRGEPRNASITLGDDGRWHSYERHPGRSEKKAGSWEPRPGNLVEFTYVWTPHRSKTPKTDMFRYLLDGDGLVRLRPGGQVFIHQPPGD
jgi:hypothetical protein